MGQGEDVRQIEELIISQIDFEKFGDDRNYALDWVEALARTIAQVSFAARSCPYMVLSLVASMMSAMDKLQQTPEFKKIISDLQNTSFANLHNKKSSGEVN